MEKEDLKKDITERMKNGDVKSFEIEKAELSKDDPILQSAKKMVGGVELDWVVKQAEQILNAKPDPNIGYPGRRPLTKIYKVIESPGKFFGFKFGKYRLGIWREEERDE